ncbi:MAG TPA: methyltransferase domain-containing protein [Kiritimatiellia bacterium]|nr:methyltransferase domain-containing protein [Kiritimatiellia bacterium]HMO98587.1 methyltransferase domain-containing protein [Kiritimatiellia bacterium]HMP95434.1 methyltransferase domain-containing protein [Kiritimatiellia bacterium]
MHAERYERVTPVQTAMRERFMLRVHASVSGFPVRRILELGCGTGPMTLWLRNEFPEAEITAVDIAPGMIDVARSRVGRVNWVVADAESLLPEASAYYDLIVSNATVQWFQQPEDTLRYFQRRLTPGGLMAWTTFGPKTFQELQTSFQAAYDQLGIPARPHNLPMLSMSYWTERFPEAEHEEAVYSCTYPDVRDFLRAVQLAGASYSPSGNQPLPRALVRAMMAYYQKHYPVANAAGIRATYHALFFYYRSMGR